MDDAHRRLINCRGLTNSEREKFDRMADMLSSVFHSAGHEDAVVCEGKGVGEVRRINFLRESLGAPFISISAIVFRSDTEDELSALITKHLLAARKRWSQ